MAKFYVSCGDLQAIVDSDNHRNAAIKAFEGLENQEVEHLSQVTVASEHGFESDADDDVYFCTIDLLEETDQIGNYKSSDWL